MYKRARRVPFSDKEKIEAELERLLEAGIIERVEHSDWASPVVVVHKPDSTIRLCGDYKSTVNRSLLVDRHPLPHPEEIFAMLAGGQQFSTLDLSNAYLQLTLDKQSSVYTTINTHKGLYRYKRLPFGIAASPAIFQRTMDNILKDIPGTICYIDDILITAKNREQHLERLEAVLCKLKSHGIKAKRSKCSFLVNSVRACYRCRRDTHSRLQS